MITATQAKDLISRWIEAANKKDVDAVLSFYSSDPELESPFVVESMQEPSGRLRGRERLRAYFTKAFSMPFVSWHLVESAWGVSSLAARYINHKGTRSITYMELDAAGKIRRHVNHFMA
jgi:hypothetical protein